MVRPQPRHSALAASITQTLVQGDITHGPHALIGFLRMEPRSGGCVGGK
jgi:hypothetical protein